MCNEKARELKRKAALSALDGYLRPCYTYGSRALQTSAAPTACTWKKKSVLVLADNLMTFPSCWRPNAG